MGILTHRIPELFGLGRTLKSSHSKHHATGKDTFFLWDFFPKIVFPVAPCCAFPVLAAFSRLLLLLETIPSSPKAPALFAGGVPPASVSWRFWRSSNKASWEVVLFFHLVFLLGAIFKGIRDLCGAHGDRNERKGQHQLLIPTPAWRELSPMGKAVGSNLLPWENAGRVVRKRNRKRWLWKHWELGKGRREGISPW